MGQGRKVTQHSRTLPEALSWLPALLASKAIKATLSLAHLAQPYSTPS